VGVNKKGHPRGEEQSLKEGENPEPKKIPGGERLSSGVKPTLCGKPKKAFWKPSGA